jgi:hypothetical protein
MLSHRRPGARVPVFVLAAALAGAPARAGEVDRYLPDDTEIVVNVNVRQILDSPLVKKHALEKLRELVKGMDQVDDILKDLGFDPFTDLDRVVAAQPDSPERDRGLLIAHGRFDLAKIKARGEQAAQDNGDVLKIHKVPDGKGGQFLVYEVALPGNNEEVSLFVAFPEKTTVLASLGKDYVVDALRKTGRKAAPALKSKEFQALLERTDVRQSISVAALGSALAKGAGREAPKQTREAVEKIDAVAGGLTIGAGIKVELVVSTKTAEDARQLKTSADAGLNQALVLLGVAANLDKNLSPVLDIVKTLRVTAKGKLVTLKGEVSADVLEEALGKEKDK